MTKQSELEKAAEEYALDREITRRDLDSMPTYVFTDILKNAFSSGAEWQKAQTHYTDIPGFKKIFEDAKAEARKEVLELLRSDEEWEKTEQFRGCGSLLLEVADWLEKKWSEK